MEPLLRSKILFATIFFLISCFVIFKCTQDGSKYLDNYITTNEKKSETHKNDSKEENQKNTEKQNALKNELLDLLSNIDKSKNDYNDIFKSLEDKLTEDEKYIEIFKDLQSKSEELEKTFGEKLKKLEEKIKNGVGN